MINRSSKVRYKLASVSADDALRICAYKSLKHVGAQVLDKENKVLAAIFTTSKKCEVYNKPKMEKAVWVGKELAKKCESFKDKKFFFDRGNFQYHGIIKSIAESARSEGMRF